MERDTRPSEFDSVEGNTSGTMPAAPVSDSAWSGAADPRFRALIEHVRELVIVHGPQGIVYANAGAVTTLGYEQASDLVGRPLDELIHPEDLGVRADDKGSATLRLVRADGSSRVADLVSTTVDFEEGSLCVSVGRDVTELHEMQGRRALHERLAALNTFVAGVAHELNNPMTYALAGVDVALRRMRVRAANEPQTADDAVVLDALDRALGGLNRMRESVRNLVTFAHGDPDTLAILDPRMVFESSIQLAWHQIRHRARLEKQMGEVPPVEANAVRLGQVFLNLLVNAAEAIPEGRADCHTVRVVTRADDNGTVIIEVADTGVGIPADALPRIFDPFFTTKGPSTGPGLGLSIAHGIVRDLGGQITVRSAVGQGTTVVVELPCARAWRRPWAQASGSKTASGDRPRVLVVDDDRLVGDAIALTLGDESDVTVVTSGGDALSRVTSGTRFDVILCDLLMPVMTGMDFYAELVRVAPESVGAVVFMTGGASTPRARAFIAGVASPCMQKPVDAKELRELVRGHCRAVLRA